MIMEEEGRAGKGGREDSETWKESGRDWRRRETEGKGQALDTSEGRSRKNVGK